MLVALGSAGAVGQDLGRACLAPRDSALQARLGTPLDGSDAGGAEGVLRLEADRLSGITGQSLQAQGSARLQRGLLSLQADAVEYRFDADRVRATGRVELLRGGDSYRGTLLDIDTRSAEGYFLAPNFRFGRTQAGGRAERVDFLGPNQLSVRGAQYSSCALEDGVTPPWVLTTRRIRINFDTNEGLADDAVVRFYGVPILAAPLLSFPVTDQRKSGWLPPRIDLASSSGLEIGSPYYWNIAPDLDATLTPTVYSKRGAGLDGEVRYLNATSQGETGWVALPNDTTRGTSRWAARWQHSGQLGRAVDYDWQLLRVADADHWRDGLRGADALTPRLLGSQAQLRQRRTLASGDWGDIDQLLYLRARTWQTLQGQSSADPLEAPYRQAPQAGALWRGQHARLQWSLQTELNRFDHQDAAQLTGERAHALASVAWPLVQSGWQLTPRLGLNAAAYRLDTPLADGRRSVARAIPTLSIDSAWVLERSIDALGTALTQTLEPRLLYVHTPWRDQSQLPRFDSAALDFNATTLFAENAFSGVDRVSDAHHITAGVSTRFIEAGSGNELARMGVAQRYLLRDQRITAEGTPQTERFSDVLVVGSTSALPRWTLDGALQFNPESDRVVRSIASARYSPGPFRTLYVSHRLQRGVSEQAAVGWQWPLGGGASRAPASDCRGTLYGVGRIDYSVRDRRMSGLIAGLEYDAGCWVGRVVANRQSTGNSAATTRLSMQLELIGLSRLGLGTNPLAVLKDNVPGYQLLGATPTSRFDTAGPGGTPGTQASP